MGAIYGVGSPGTVNAASGGKVYAINTLSTTGIEVAPENPARAKITFHNPGTVDAIVYPEKKQNTGSNVTNSVTTGALGGGLRIYGNGGQLTIEGECQGAWFALAIEGTGHPLTVIDTNVP